MEESRVELRGVAVIPSFGKFTSAIQVFKAKIPPRVTVQVPRFS
jgi:hypothetical protein